MKVWFVEVMDCHGDSDGIYICSSKESADKKAKEIVDEGDIFRVFVTEHEVIDNED